MANKVALVFRDMARQLEERAETHRGIALGLEDARVEMLDIARDDARMTEHMNELARRLGAVIDATNHLRRTMESASAQASEASDHAIRCAGR